MVKSALADSFQPLGLAFVHHFSRLSARPQLQLHHLLSLLSKLHQHVNMLLLSIYTNRNTWAARYNIWLLINLTPKGVVFSVLFFFYKS